MWNENYQPSVNMDLVGSTLNGTAAKSSEDGQRAHGRHATIIRMGRALWQTPALTTEQQLSMKDCFFDDGSFPTSVESREALLKAKAR